MRTENGDWEVLGPASGDIEDTFQTWSKLVKRADALVATDYEPLFVEAMGTGLNLAHQLRNSGLGFFNWTSPDALSISNGEFISPEGQRAATLALKIAAQRASTILSDDASVLLIEPTAKWLPPVLPENSSIQKQSDLDDIITAIIAVRHRTEEEQEALESLRSQFPMIDFVEADGSEPVEGTIFIDSLSGGAWNTLTEEAFAAGIPVLANFEEKLGKLLDLQPPYIATPTDLLNVNFRLALSGRCELPDASEYFEQREHLLNQAFQPRDL